MSHLESLLADKLTTAGFPPAEREFRFDPDRKWRFDLAWEEHRIAVEIEGGIWNGGRHTRPVGFHADIEKYNAATLAGWDLYRVTGTMIANGSALKLIESALTNAMAGQPA